jgi:hypothetical protein
VSPSKQYFPYIGLGILPYPYGYLIAGFLLKPLIHTDETQGKQLL